MAKQKQETVATTLFWSYANLAMAHSVLGVGAADYTTVNYMIRARLFKGLVERRMNVGSMLDDERFKVLSQHCCSYCGSPSNPSLDHVFPKVAGGTHSADNLVLSCRSCNSSKSKQDLLVWMNARKTFPPLSVLRRYLKLAVANAEELNAMECPIMEIGDTPLQFRITAIPLKYPRPAELRWAFGVS